MKAHFGQPVDRAELERIPPPSLVWRVLKWMIPILLVVAIVWFGLRESEDASFTDAMLAWILPTSIGAAAFTLLAGGCLLSVLTALVVAPVAAIHPLIGTGMVVGVVEAWWRKPSVADCERLPEDVETLRGYWRNPVTRILIIAVASGIGTILGFSSVVVSWVASLL
jgi:pheromone shutdown protein TraB